MIAYIGCFGNKWELSFCDLLDVCNVDCSRALAGLRRLWPLSCTLRNASHSLELGGMASAMICISWPCSCRTDLECGSRKGWASHSSDTFSLCLTDTVVPWFMSVICSVTLGKMATYVFVWETWKGGHAFVCHSLHLANKIKILPNVSIGKPNFKQIIGELRQSCIPEETGH